MNGGRGLVGSRGPSAVADGVDVSGVRLFPAPVPFTTGFVPGVFDAALGGGPRPGPRPDGFLAGVLVAAVGVFYLAVRPGETAAAGRMLYL